MSNPQKIKDLESLIYNLELELKKTKVVLGELQGKKSKAAVDYGVKAAEYGRESTEGWSAWYWATRFFSKVTR